MIYTVNGHEYDDTKVYRGTFGDTCAYCQRCHGAGATLVSILANSANIGPCSMAKAATQTAPTATPPGVSGHSFTMRGALNTCDNCRFWYDPYNPSKRAPYDQVCPNPISKAATAPQTAFVTKLDGHDFVPSPVSQVYKCLRCDREVSVAELSAAKVARNGHFFYCQGPGSFSGGSIVPGRHKLSEKTVGILSCRCGLTISVSQFGAVICPPCPDNPAASPSAQQQIYATIASGGQSSSPAMAQGRAVHQTVAAMYGWDLASPTPKPTKQSGSCRSCRRDLCEYLDAYYGSGPKDMCAKCRRQTRAA